jgi:polar amino acid transport system substrate-binding protein
MNMKRLLGCILVGLILMVVVVGAYGCGQGEAKVRVATDATWPPFEYVNEDTMEIEGFDIDLFTAIAEAADIDVEFLNVAWDPLLAGVAQCQYDAAISSITITPERAEEMLFSDPYFEAGQLISVRIDNTDINSKEDLDGKTAGAQIGTTGSFEIEAIEGATLKTYDDIGLAFQDLMNGQIDAIVADSPLTLGYVNANPDKIKTVGEMLTSESYGIAVCKDNPELLDKINAGLAQVKADGIIDELIDEWSSWWLTN